MKKIGSCHCGSIEIRSNYAPMLINQCNCTSCRKLYSVLSVTGIFSQEEIEVSGDLKKYTYNGGSGGDIELFFCPNCSTKAYYSVEVIEGLAIIPIGTLDDSTKHEPDIEIFTNSKLNWLSDNGCISERFEEAAVMERIEKVILSLSEREL